MRGRPHHRLAPRPRKRQRGPLDQPTDRERDVLAPIAEGHSNSAVAERLYLSRKTVETHITQILLKLDLADSPERHRRVLAVLAWLRSSQIDPESSGCPGVRRDPLGALE